MLDWLDGYLEQFLEKFFERTITDLPEKSPPPDKLDGPFDFIANVDPEMQPSDESEDE